MNKQFLEDDILGSGLTQWPWWGGVVEMRDGDLAVEVTAETAEETDIDQGIQLVTPEVIRKAFLVWLERYPWNLDALCEGGLDLDADTADQVLQVAVLGEIVYG